MVSPKEKAIQHTINKMSIEKLLDLWEETEKQVISIELAMVREWIMTALEAKNPDAFNRWMDAEYTTPESDMPRTYFAAHHSNADMTVKEKAINKLLLSGLSLQNASEQFKEQVCYYMRGIDGYNKHDAEVAAAETILSEEEITSDYSDMLNHMYR